mmetsp:Transcript_56412/g.163625  ORF Transcript_56412/g.163625 Transcript_56412/m.163625 type:complete len:214 (+) Transcript_56412:183-824(+)
MLHAEVHAICPGQHIPVAALVGLHEVRGGRVQPHGHRLPDLHVDSVKAEEHLQRHAARARTGRREEAQHDLIGVHAAGVRHIHRVAGQRASAVAAAEEHAVARSAKELLGRGEGDRLLRGAHEVVPPRRVGQAEAEGQDRGAGVETIGAPRVGALGAMLLAALLRGVAVRAGPLRWAGPHVEVEDRDLVHIARRVQRLHQPPCRRLQPEQHIA